MPNSVKTIYPSQRSGFAYISHLLQGVFGAFTLLWQDTDAGADAERAALQPARAFRHPLTRPAPRLPPPASVRASSLLRRGDVASFAIDWCILSFRM